MLIKRDSLLYYVGWITVISTALISHTILPVPPALLLFCIVIFGIMLLFRAGYGTMPLYSLIALPFIVFLTFAQPLTGASVRNYVGPIVSAIYFPVTIYYLQFLTKEQLGKIVKAFLIISTVILFFETAYRYMFPNYSLAEAAQQNNTEVFYMYKASSLMYTDSNGAAIHMLCVLFFAYYWGSVTGEKYRLIKWILVLIMGLTISRAAWIGTFIGVLYFKWFRGRSLFFLITSGTIVTTLLLTVFLVFILPVIKNDGSLLSKFEIAELIIQYYEKGPSFIEQAIGVGVYMSKNIFGIYAHNFLAVQLIEMGFISVVLLFFMLGGIVYYSKGKAMIVLIPFFITTLSSTLSFMPVFYTVLAIICVYENRFNIENE